MVRKSLLTSAKGRGGGFALARPPAKISLYDIVAVVDGIDGLESCAVGMAQCSDRQPCPMHQYWEPIRGKIKDFLVETTLQHMAKSLSFKLKSLGEKMPQPKSKSKPLRISR